MTRLPLVLAALGAFGALGGGGLGTPKLALADEADCVPAVVLSGDATDELAGVLAARGLESNPTASCGELRIAVSTAADGQISLVRDADDGTPRVVVDTAAAATVIESWARAGLADPLLATRDVRGSGLPEVRVVSVAPRPAPTRRLEVGGGGGVAVAADGSTWTAVDVFACVNINIICVGAVVRAAIDNRTGGDSVALEANRFGIDTLFTVDVPIRRGGWSLYPGLGVGQGFQQTIRDEDGDGDELGGVRVRAHLGVTVRLRGNISLLVNPEVVWSPGNPKVVVDSDEGPDVIRYPGDPGLHARLGIGLLWEAL